MKKGILVTIMGITNMGKTTQADMLRNRLSHEGLSFQSLKYPLYNLEPTGLRISDFLRKGNPENLTPKDFQYLCAQNRKDFDIEIRKILSEHKVVIAEMYTGTGIAYGMGDGLDKNYLIEINKGILEPDVSILLDGERFLESEEQSHVYENDHDKTERIRKIHLDLAKEFNWIIINANLPREEIHEQIFQIILEKLKTNGISR
jgi:dTMP kinase